MRGREGGKLGEGKGGTERREEEEWWCGAVKLLLIVLALGVPCLTPSLALLRP